MASTPTLSRRAVTISLPKQLSQFDDCVASKPDAILVSAITEAGIAGRLEDAMKKGIPIIAVANPVEKTPITALITTDHKSKGYLSGKALVDKLGEKGGKVVAFPGPQNSGWAENYLVGFKNAPSKEPRSSCSTSSSARLESPSSFGSSRIPCRLILT